MHTTVRYLLVLLVGALATSWMAFRPSEGGLSPAESIGQTFLQDLQQLDRDLYQLKQFIDDADEDNFEHTRDIYLDVRAQYKKVEPLLAHLQGEVTVQRINGAPLPKIDPMEESQPLVLPPRGLQVIDELMFDNPFYDHVGALDKEITLLKRELQLLIKFFRTQPPISDRLIIEACRIELVRIFTLGVTGFDTPGSVNALKDAKAALKQVTHIMLQYQSWLIDAGEVELATDMQQQFEDAQAFLNRRHGFGDFDRMAFLRDHIDPLYSMLLDVHLALNIETMYEISPYHPPLNYMGRHMFSDEFLNREAYVKMDAKDEATAAEKVELGRFLFFDPVLSESNERSCASCHQPDKGFTDHQARSIATDFDGTVSRNAPTVLNAVYSDKFFHDLRSSELEMQVDHVVFSEKEFATNYSNLLARLKSSPEYVELFYAAYPRYKDFDRSPITPNTLKGALAAYVKSLSSFNSPFDRYARGENDTLSEAAIRGFNIFMGKGACGTCHFAPTFHGIVPPNYKDSESEVLGVPSEPVWKKAIVDADYGRAANGVPLDESEIFLYSFKTPTVRNISLTAPYMHNGVYDSLEQVMRFYNVGGGKGIGIHLENQTLPFDNLGLADSELNDVIAFMETLTDTTGLTSKPSRLPEFPANSPYRERVIGGMY